jgi:uncharacterized FlaG/YvyC family protein
MTKIEISGEEAAAAIEMMGMSQPENPAEAKLKASLMSKMAAIYRAEQLAEKKAKDDKAKKTVEMISNAINACLEKYNAELVLSRDEFGVPVIAVYDIETGVKTLL